MSVENIKDSSPNEAAVALIEKVLASLKSGESRSVLTVIGWDDDSVSHCWALDKRNTCRRMLAELVMVQHEFVVHLGLSEGDSVLSKRLEDLS